MRRFLGLLVAAGVLVTPAATGVLPALADKGPLPPGLGVRLVDVPVSAKNDPRAHAYIVDVVRPGTRFSRRFEVLNGTSHPMTVHLYAAAAHIDATGFVVGRGEAASELTSWISVSPSTLTLAPETTHVVTASFAVPANVATGERYAALLAETQGVRAPGSSSAAINSRVGIRVYLDVAFGAPPIDFSISTLTAGRAADGSPTVTANVTNTGKRALDLTGTLTLDRGPGGLRAGPFKVAVPRTLAISATGGVLVTLDKSLPAGPWHARMILQSDTVRHGVEGTLTFPAARGASAAPVAAHPISLAKNRHLLVPIAIGMILALLIGLFLFLLWKRRRRKEDEEEQGKGGAGTPPAIPGQRASRDQAVRR